MILACGLKMGRPGTEATIQFRQEKAVLGKEAKLTKTYHQCHSTM